MKAGWTPTAISQAVIAIYCLTALLVVLVLSYYVQPPADNQRIIDMITGGLLTVGFANIVGFYYGQKEQAEQAVKVAAAASTAPVTIDPPATVTQTTKIEPGV